MLFIPYRVDLELYRVPFVTIAVCVVCLIVYWSQFHNEQKVFERTETFCNARTETMYRIVMDKTVGGSDPFACAQMLWSIRLAPDPDARLDELAEQSERLAGLTPESSRAFVRDHLQQQYAAFERDVPPYETQALWYDPQSWNPLAMISSTFAHGSWDHVIGNLFFFFAFAATVEVIIGPLTFIGMILAIALGESTLYSLAMLGAEKPLPTVGLSGVVMGMMALFAYFLPWGRIRCVFWFLVWFRVFAIPAWILVLWFVGWDVYTLFFTAEHHGVNLVAHVGGATLGLLFGLLLFCKRRNEIRELAQEALTV